MILLRIKLAIYVEDDDLLTFLVISKDLTKAYLIAKETTYQK